MPQHNTYRSRLAQGWLRGEDFWGDPVTDNFIKLDMLLHPLVQSMSFTVPPAAGLGDMFIVAPGGVDDWAGHDNHLAIFNEDGWYFFTPYPGVRARIKSLSAWYWWNGTAWLDEGAGDPDEPVQGTKYDLSISVGYEAEPLDVLVVLPVIDTMSLPAGAPQSRAMCAAVPDSPMILSIRRNSAEVGTITFSPGNTKGVVAVPQTVAFAGGVDVLTVTMPDNPPAGFENYGVVLRLLIKP